MYFLSFDKGLTNFNSNIIDPIKLTFDKALFKKSIEEIIELKNT